MKPARSPAQRFKLLIAGALALGLVLAPLALVYLQQTGTPLHLHLVIALSLAIICTLLLAAALMGLLFYSSSSGHDERVGEDTADTIPAPWRDDR